MKNMNKEQRSRALYDALEALATAENLNLVDVEVKGHISNPVVQVFLDKEGGVGIDDLAAANKWIGVTLDELVMTRYTLEVSSPGGRTPRAKVCDDGVNADK